MEPPCRGLYPGGVVRILASPGLPLSFSLPEITAHKALGQNQKHLLPPERPVLDDLAAEW